MFIDFIINNIFYFLIILARLTGIFFIAPVLGSASLPRQTRLLISIGISIIIYPVAKQHIPYVFNYINAQFIYVFINNLCIGLLIGIFLQIIFATFGLAGQFYGIQIGFGIVSVMDPLSEQQLPILGQLKTLFATLLFLGIDGHLILIKAITESFRHLTVLHYSSLNDLVAYIVLLMTKSFYYAFMLGFPIIGALFITSLTLGLISKSAPQMNVLILGFPLYILIGFVILSLSVGLIGKIFLKIFDITFMEIEKLILLCQI